MEFKATKINEDHGTIRFRIVMNDQRYEIEIDFLQIPQANKKEIENLILEELFRHSKVSIIGMD